MPRNVRVEFDGAIYHVMSRGDRGERIFQNERDRVSFLETLGEACKRSGAVVLSYVLMENHYHLLLCTPKGNLVKTMQWLQGTYTARFNARHKVRGHLFQGRYKALAVDPEHPEYARVVSDYIHLNPARAGMLNRENPALIEYRWSSFPLICRGGDLPDWLDGGTVLHWQGWQITKGRDRAAFQRYLQKRACECLSEKTEKRLQEEWEPVRSGWCFGSDAFRRRLEDLASGVVSKRKRKSYRGDALRSHDEAQATQLLECGMKRLDLDHAGVGLLRKNDLRKQGLAWLIKSNTVVGDAWVCRMLGMGDRSNVSRAVGRFRRGRENAVIEMMKKLHICTD